jgi:hypothetical protein
MTFLLQALLFVMSYQLFRVLKQISRTYIWGTVPIAMQRDLRQWRCAICGSDFLLLYFQSSAQHDFLRHFFIPDNIATSFPPALSWRFAI